MRLALLLAVALPALAQEQEVQRALIERDQRTLEFAARVRGASLAERQEAENLSAAQLLRVEKDLLPGLRAYERQKAAAEHILAPPPRVVRAELPEGPRPLPRAMPGAVDLVRFERAVPGR